MKYKFYQLGVSICWRSFKCSSTNSTNERIAESTNETNKDINQRTNEYNERMTRETNAQNAENVRLTNESNERMARENNELQMQLQREQNDWNLQMFNLENAYNSPSAQLERAKEAGINPNVVFGNPVAASAPQQTSLPVTSASVNQVAQGVSPKASPYTAQGYVATPEGSFAGKVAQSLGNLNASLNAANQFYESDAKRMQNQFLPAMLSIGKLTAEQSLENLVTDNDVKKAQQKVLMKQADGTIQSILESQQKIRNLQGEFNLLNEKVYQEKINSAFYFQEKTENYKALQKQNQMTDLQMWAVHKRCEYESMLAYSQANNLNWQSKLLETENSWKQELLNKGMPEKEIQQIAVGVRLAASQASDQELRNEVYKIYGESMAKEGFDKAHYENSFIGRTVSVAGGLMVGAGALGMAGAKFIP